MGKKILIEEAEHILKMPKFLLDAQYCQKLYVVRNVLWMKKNVV